MMLGNAPISSLSYKRMQKDKGLDKNDNPYLKFIQQFGAEQLDAQFVVSGLLWKDARET